MRHRMLHRRCVCRALKNRKSNDAVAGWGGVVFTMKFNVMLGTTALLAGTIILTMEASAADWYREVDSARRIRPYARLRARR